MSALRRARTRLLLAPALAAIKQYRAEVVEHLDTTIARLEALVAWCDGGDLPTWTARYGELLRAASESGPDHPEITYKDANEEICRDYNIGTVDVCDAALLAVTSLATGASYDDSRDHTIDDHVRDVAEALYASNPTEHYVMLGPLRAFCAEIEAAGLEVRDWERDRDRREHPEKYASERKQAVAS